MHTMYACTHAYVHTRIRAYMNTCTYMQEYVNCITLHCNTVQYSRVHCITLHRMYVRSYVQAYVCIKIFADVGNCSPAHKEPIAHSRQMFPHQACEIVLNSFSYRLLRKILANALSYPRLCCFNLQVLRPKTSRNPRQSAEPRRRTKAAIPRMAEEMQFHGGGGGNVSNVQCVGHHEFVRSVFSKIPRWFVHGTNKATNSTRKSSRSFGGPQAVYMISGNLPK